MHSYIRARYKVWRHSYIHVWRHSFIHTCQVQSVNHGRTNASLYDMTSKADEIVTALRLAWDLYSNPAQTRKGMYIYIYINVYIFIYIYIDSVDTKVGSVFDTSHVFCIRHIPLIRHIPRIRQIPLIRHIPRIRCTVFDLYSDRWDLWDLYSIFCVGFEFESCPNLPPQKHVSAVLFCMYAYTYIYVHLHICRCNGGVYIGFVFESAQTRSRKGVFL